MNHKSKYSGMYFQTWIDAATYTSLDILHLDEEYNTSHSKNFPCHCSGWRTSYPAERFQSGFFFFHSSFYASPTWSQFTCMSWITETFIHLGQMVKSMQYNVTILVNTSNMLEKKCWKKVSLQEMIKGTSMFVVSLICLVFIKNQKIWGSYLCYFKCSLDTKMQEGIWYHLILVSVKQLTVQKEFTMNVTLSKCSIWLGIVHYPELRLAV